MNHAGSCCCQKVIACVAHHDCTMKMCLRNVTHSMRPYSYSLSATYTTSSSRPSR